MESKIDLKLFIDLEKNRVVFLECDRDFVDILLSFLVMPIGAVVRLTGKRSGLGCMDALYENIEKLDLNFFQAPACKDMLLNPNYAWRSDYCNDLVIKIDPEPQYSYYVCPVMHDSNTPCEQYRHDFIFSTVKTVKCKCGSVMEKPYEIKFSDKVYSTPDVGVFIKSEAKYIVSDDLRISPYSASKVILLLRELEIKGCNELCQKTISVGRDEVLLLLKYALVSKSPLSDVFLANGSTIYKPVEAVATQTRIDYGKCAQLEDSEGMCLRLFLNKSTKSMIFAEADKDVVELLFSFLTLPLGIIFNLYQEDISLGSLNQRRSSVVEFQTQKLLRTKEHSLTLLQPKVAPHHVCEKRVLNMQEGDTSSWLYGYEYTARNSKLNYITSSRGGGYMKGRLLFMISNELQVEIASASNFSARVTNVSYEDVEEKTVYISFNLIEGFSDVKHTAR